MNAWTMSEPAVGHSAERSRLVTSRDFELFAELSGEGNPLRDDDGVASATSFGGGAAQAGIGSAILNAVLAEDLLGPGSVFLELNLTFAAPIRPGDVISGFAEVTSIRTDVPITGLTVRVSRDDGLLALVGTAVCYTVPGAAPALRALPTADRGA